jgi:superfamily II DNA or RNA helicase
LRSSATLCAETLAGIADPLFPALAVARRAHPEEAARTILAGLVGPLDIPGPDVAPVPWLLPHQSEAALRAWSILARFGGVLVADAVGLGKTFVGLALAELEARQGGDTCVIAPAALRHEWRQAAQSVGRPLTFVSHTALARRRDLVPSTTLLVVDEAHAFRNASTRRYDTLARLAIGRRLVLLTATPVNNSAADLAALIHLFAGADDFRAFGVADILASLRSRDGADAALALAALTVSRSRRLVESQFPALRGAFPRRVLFPPVRYDLDAAYGGALADLVEALGELDPGEAPAERGAALLALGLLRRLESSRDALLRSLRRHDEFLRDWSAARESGRVLSRRDFRAGAAVAGDGARQLVLWSLLLGPATTDVARAEHAWRGTIERALALAEASAQRPDPKLDALAGLLAGPLRHDKTIVFTEYRDTALAIARRLRHRFRLLCVAGDGAWAGTERLPRREALDAFAPRARDAVVHPLLAADVLVATDVAAEGMNLQDASAVVNFDLPWNPVRVMQRVGRIDRLHSPHAQVSVAHLVPGHGMHHLTGVLRVLRAKLAALPVAAAPEPDPLSALWWLDAPLPLPDALEWESWRRVEPFEARERWRAAAGTMARSDRAVISAGIACDEGPPVIGLLLALEWPGGRRVPLPFVLEAGGTCRCDAAALGALAERARRARPLCASPPEFATSLAAALPEARRKLAEWSAVRHGSQPRGPGRIAALRTVARLARAAAQERDAPRLEILSQASLALTRELPAGLDRTLFDACRSGDDRAVLPALAALRLGGRAGAPGLPSGTPRLVLAAAIVLAVRGPEDEAAVSAPAPAAAAS